MTRSDESIQQQKSPLWLWSLNTPFQYVQWSPRDPFFHNDHKRRWLLLEATCNKREEQQKAIVNIFNNKHVHQVTFLQSQDNNHNWYLHVKVLSNDGSDNTTIAPKLAELIPVIFSIFDDAPDITYEISMQYKGRVINTYTNADSVVYYWCGFSPELNGKSRYIVATIKPNLMPINAQIQTLKEASKAAIYGDHPDQSKMGFSLRHTILAHATELDPESANYFLLNARQILTVPMKQQEERLEYISKVFTLDKTQSAAFKRSILSICGGIHLIQTPPGTGKTRTAMAIILMLAALNIKVLLATGSNKVVDNLAKELVKALKQHLKLRNWYGQLV
jgi:hypothetical protein